MQNIAVPLILSKLRTTTTKIIF